MSTEYTLRDFIDNSSKIKSSVILFSIEIKSTTGFSLTIIKIAFGL